jgi:hypothetical protein
MTTIGPPGGPNLGAIGSAGLSGGPPLEAFSRAAEQGSAITMSVDGQSLQVLGQGELRTGGGPARSVAWVQAEPNAGASDATQAFVNALNSAHGERLSQAVAKELGLSPRPGVPLESRTVQQAVDMAHTAATALEGVAFLSSLTNRGV